MKMRLILCLAITVLPACAATPEPTAESPDPLAATEVEEVEEVEKVQKVQKVQKVEEESALVYKNVGDFYSGKRLIGEARVEGVMRFSWHDDWSEGEKSQRMWMRFYLADGEASSFPEIPDEHYDRTPKILFFYTSIDDDGGLVSSEVPQQTRALAESLDEVPARFLAGEQESTEVVGSLVFRDLISTIVCDSPDSMVRLESFEASADEDAHQNLVMRIRNGEAGEDDC